MGETGSDLMKRSTWFDEVAKTGRGKWEVLQTRSAAARLRLIEVRNIISQCVPARLYSLANRLSWLSSCRVAPLAPTQIEILSGDLLTPE